MARFGPTELIVLLLGFLIPLLVSFSIGYYFGKKSGYIKRVKEENHSV